MDTLNLNKFLVKGNCFNLQKQSQQNAQHTKQKKIAPLINSITNHHFLSQRDVEDFLFLILFYYHCTQAKGKHGATWFREETITNELGKVFLSLQMPKNILEDTINLLAEVHKNKVNFHKQENAKLLKEQDSLSIMMDNLYMDKLKGSITDAQYDKFFTTLRAYPKIKMKK